MIEQYVQLPLVERQPEKTTKPPRRLRCEEPTTRYDFSHLDFSEPAIQASLARAYAVLLAKPDNPEQRPAGK